MQLLLLIYLAVIILSIYCIVLYIKLATRGIEALDIYINKNKSRNYQDKDNINP